MKSPSERRLLLAVPFAGSTRAMYFSPRRLVWRTSTCTFSGRLMSLRTTNFTRARQPTRSTSVTCPTTTSSTMTAVRGTTLRASAKSALTR